MPSEPGLDAQFVPLAVLPRLDVRPPLAGHLRALHACGDEPTAAYLGNLWRPQRRDGTETAPLEAAGGGLP